MSTHSDQLEQLIPVQLGETFLGDISVEGLMLDAVDAAATALELQLVPNQAGTTKIAGWERNLAIVPPVGATLSQRQASVVAKLAARGGLSKGYFIAIAAALGYSISIWDMHPFEFGIGMFGYPIWSCEIPRCWRVNVLNTELSSSDFTGKNPAAQTGDGQGYLWRWDAIAGPMETLFNQLRPAGTVPLFYYPFDGLGGEMAWQFFDGAPDNTVGANGDGGMVFGGSNNGNVYKKISGVWTLQGNIQGPGYNLATSDTLSMTLGSQTFGVTVDASESAYVVGQWIQAVFDSDNSMYGIITAYTGTSMTVNWLKQYGSEGEPTSATFTSSGPPGATWFDGSGAPSSSLGNDGDFYIDLASSDLTVYTKEDGTWS